MKDGILSEQEVEALDEIENINPSSNAIAILYNAEKFFAPYLKKTSSTSIFILANLAIYSILKKVDSIGEEASKYLIKKYSTLEWIKQVIYFYSYCVDVLDIIINKHDDTMLDLYNDGSLSKEMLSKTLTSFGEMKNQFIKERESLLKLLDEIEITKKEWEENNYGGKN